MREVSPVSHENRTKSRTARRGLALASGMLSLSACVSLPGVPATPSYSELLKPCAQNDTNCQTIKEQIKNHAYFEGTMRISHDVGAIGVKITNNPYFSLRIHDLRCSKTDFLTGIADYRDALITPVKSSGESFSIVGAAPTPSIDSETRTVIAPPSITEDPLNLLCADGKLVKGTSAQAYLDTMYGLLAVQQ